MAEDILNNIKVGKCFYDKESNEEMCDDLADLIYKLENLESEEKEYD